MSQKGIEIASHTVSHPDLTSLKDDDLQSELEESKRAISEKLSQLVEGMAFPYGKTNLRIQRRAEELGYNYAVTSGTDFVNGLDASLRIYHASPGNIAHDLYLDYVEIIDLYSFMN